MVNARSKSLPAAVIIDGIDYPKKRFWDMFFDRELTFMAFKCVAKSYLSPSQGFHGFGLALIFLCWRPTKRVFFQNLALTAKFWSRLSFPKPIFLSGPGFL